MPKPQHRTPQTLDHDTAGGAILRHARPTTRLAIPNLRALDIHRSPQLEALDLTACAPGVHVGIRQAPRLRRIMVPTGGPGAVIHVDAGRHAPALLVTGAVDEIDACWQHGRFRLTAPGLPPWQNVALNTAPADTAEAVVLATDTGLLTSAVHANNALRDLHLLDQALPDDLDLAHLPHLIAEPFFRHLAKAHRPEHVAALADAVQRARSRGRRPLPTYTRTLQTAIPRCCRRLPGRPRSIDIDTVLSLIHGAVLTEDAAAAEAIRQLVNDHLKPEATLPALQCLVEHGHGPARSDLWVLATTANQPDIRNRAQRAALAPARSTALTPANHEETPHDHA